MNHTKHIAASLSLAVALVAGAHVVAPRPLHGQTTITLDGTSGSGSISTDYTLSDNTTVNLGFFAEYLLVGGGGGGGAGFWIRASGGGGGGGGMVEGSANLSASSYAVFVGPGGIGGAGSTTPAANGGDSSAFGVTAVGGGRGGQWLQTGSNVGAGGSGGGGGTSTGGGQGGTGTEGQGFGGGQAANFDSASLRGSGGGGGAGGLGGSVTSTGSGGGAGGLGASSSITGSAVLYAAGGGGGGQTGGAGTSGISGNGGGTISTGAPGAANTGGGGGGGGSVNIEGASRSGGAGGSGVVIVRYAGAAAATGGTVTAGTNSATGYTLHTFTTAGTNSFDLSGVNMSQRLGATLTGAISGSGDLVFDGPGRLSLTGTNTYTGATTISAGTLAINGNNSAATGAVTVASGATLAGSGTVGGATTVQSGATHAPGNSPGLQTFNDGLTYATGSTFEWDLIGNTVDGRGTSFDGVNVSGGTLSIGTGVTSSLVFNAAGSTVNWNDSFWDSDRSWLVFANTNSPSLESGSLFDLINVSPDSLGMTLTSVRSDASFAWAQQGNDVYLTFIAVPEPSTYALFVLAAAGLGVRTWRKRRFGQ
jgi:hypothetical protein